MIGKNIGDYRILAKTRLGESGPIYKALHIQQRQTYALKLIKGPLSNESPNQQLFLQKLEIAENLNHPHIARIFPRERYGEYTLVPMEFVYGQNLSEKISEGRSSFDFTLKVALQAADALIFAHEVGMVHERLTSNNLMVSAEGDLKILNFAMCCLPEEIESSEPEDDLYTSYYHQPVKPPLSKFAYLAPEQVRGNPADVRSDLFSLGVILYELLVGEFLFEGEKLEDLYQQILERDLPKLSQIRSDTPSGWSQMLKALVQRNPVKRYSSARELMTDLYGLRDGTAVDQRGFLQNRPITRRSFFRHFIGERDE